MRLLKGLSVVLMLSMLASSCTHNGAQERKNPQSLFNHADPAIAKLLDSSVAYVIFPEVGKAGLVIGGAHGKGDVYEKGLLGYSMVGHAELTQVNAGLQAGAQIYSEMIFFESEAAFQRFKHDEIHLSANASAIFFERGQKIKIAYKDGMAVVVLRKDGLMAELSIGGQKLKFLPL